MTVGVILETLVKIVADRLRIRIKTRIARGRGNLRDKIVSYAYELSRYCNKVLAVVDSHCSDPHVVQRDFRNSSASGTINIQICVVVHAIESWLLADSQALTKKLRTRTLRTPTNPETSAVILKKNWIDFSNCIE